MFRNLNEEIKSLNSDVNNVANSERAKKLRKKLLGIGIPMVVVGFLGVIACFILIPTGIISPMLIPAIFLPCGLIATIGMSIASMGFRIVVAGYTSNLIDDTVGNNCPKCGDKIDADEMFCSKCGFQVKKECPNCKTINSHKDSFCKKCGKEL